MESIADDRYPENINRKDNWIVSFDIQKRLEQFGYHVVGTAATGKAAIHSASELSPDLVLMDINLDGAMDGIEAAYEIQRKYGLPIVFLTAFSDEVTKKRPPVSIPWHISSNHTVNLN